MATRLRQAAAAAVVAGRGRVPGVRHRRGPYPLAQAAVVAAFWLVWATALPLVGARRALVAVLIVDGLHFFQYQAAKFNHDVIQLPFWALAGYAFHAALKHGRVLHWCLLGIAIGLSLWAKYFVVVWRFRSRCSCCSTTRRARQWLRTPGPWVAAVIALAIMALPHLIWLGAERLPALRVCQRPRGAVAPADRPRPASGDLRDRSTRLPAARAADSLALLWPAGNGRRRSRPMRSTAAS